MTTQARARRKFRSVLGRLCLCSALVAVVAFEPLPAHAQAVDDATHNAARRLAEAGVESYQHGDYDNAADQLNRAYAVLRVPSIGLWSGRALSKLGRLVEANERYLEVTRMNDIRAGDAAIQKTAQADAQTEADALAPRIPTVGFELTGAAAGEVELRVDGTLVPSSLLREPWPVDPGTRTVQGKRGSEVVTVSVTLKEGGTARAALHFTGTLPVSPQAASPAPTQPNATPDTAAHALPHSNAQRTAGWVTLGVGGAALVFGGVTGILLVSKHGSLEDSCHGSVCAASKQSDVSSFNSLRTLSSVGLIAGAALSAGGAVLLLTARPMSRVASRRAYLGASELGLRGSF